MDFHSVLQVLLFVMCSLLVAYNGVEAGNWTSSEQEDLELEKQLKLLNKPAVKTIQTDYGDIYDCVDFYKQPAFDHPLLKNHSFHFQMKPISLPKRTKDQVSSSKVERPVHIGLKDGGCPFGTVPIRRITKEDLIREKLASKIVSLADNTPGAHYAVMRTRGGPNMYNGAGAILTVHNPQVNRIQYSAGRFKFQNGPDTIQVGWRVDPGLYGDTRTRLFIRLDAGQSHCFNTRCPGFVLVRADLPPDIAPPQTSRPGVPIEVELYIIRDKANGNWWLEVGKDNTPVGFWPQRIFTGLQGLANYVEWGGEVFSPPGTPTPAMGSGSFLRNDTKYDAYFRLTTVINNAFQTVDADNTELFADNSILYEVGDRRVGGDYFRHLVWYGGPPTR